MQSTRVLADDKLGRLVVVDITELVAVVDAEGIVLFASAMYEQQLDYAHNALIGRSLTRLIHRDERDRIVEACAACRAARPAALGEFRLQHRDGRWIGFEGDVAVIDAGGAELRLVTVHAVDERIRQVRAEYEFVANAAHELLTPLAAMSAAIEVLQSGAKDIPAERDVFLADLEREIDRLGRLAQALLMLARVQATGEAPPMCPVEIRPLVHEVAERLRAGTEVAIDVECGGEIVVLAERDLLERALTNLAENAAAHTVRGCIVLGAWRCNDRVDIEVRDTGSGMPPDQQARVLDRFYRAEARADAGFGLGLAIVREIAWVLDGSLTIESEPGVGTAVRLNLPAVA